MKLFRCLAGLLAFACLPAPAFSQSANGVMAPAGAAPMNSPCSLASDNKCYANAPARPMYTGLATATSTPCVISATASAVTITPGVGVTTQCASSGSAGAYKIGAFTPQPGYPVRLIAVGTWSGSIAVGTSVDGCTTINPLTVAGQAWGTYTANANEAVDVPATTGGVAYCLTVSVTSGTLNAALRQ